MTPHPLEYRFNDLKSVEAVGLLHESARSTAAWADASQGATGCGNPRQLIGSSAWLSKILLAITIASIRFPNHTQRDLQVRPPTTWKRRSAFLAAAAFRVTSY
jgi:hypothetical protein